MIGLDRMGTNRMRPLLQARHPCQAYDACDHNALATYPVADITIEHIDDLLWYDLPALIPSDQTGNAKTASNVTAGGK
jgi:6-phosphogluconate dehydrogenase (decarboxylating)